MIIYALLFFLFLLAALQQTVFKQRTILFALTIVLSAIIVGIRYKVGNDWGEYVDYYKTIPILEHLRNLSYYRYENLYTILNSLFKTAGLGYQFFFFVFSLTTSVILLIAIRNFNRKYIYLSFLIYFGYHFLQYEMNMIRHGMAASIIFLAFYYSAEKKLGRYMLCIFVASMIQLFSLIFIPFYWLNRIRINGKGLLIIMSISIILYVLMDFFSITTSIPLFQHQIEYYLGDFYVNRRDESSYGITVGMVFYFIVGLLARFKYMRFSYENDSQSRVLINLLLFSFIIGLSLNQVGIFVERIVGVVNMSIIVVLPQFLDIFPGKKRMLFLCGIFIYCLWSFNTSVHMKGNNNRVYQFVPYNYHL